MLGLFLKDFYSLKFHVLLFAGIMVLCCVTAVLLETPIYIVYMGMVFSSTISMTVFSYEEKEGWQKFIAASGIDAKTIAAEKYLFVGLYILIFAIGGAVTFAVSDAISPVEFILPICLSVIAVAFVIPALFAFGSDSARIVLIVVVVLVMLIFIYMMTWFDVVDLQFISNNVFIVCLVLGTAILLAASFALSVKKIKSKQY